MTGAEFDGVDIDLLADYIGGALEGTADESVVAARVADDPAWAAAYESLGGGMALVGAELGRWEAEPMPAELAAQLDTMLREQPTADNPATDNPAGDQAPDLAAARPPHLTLVHDNAAPGSDATSSTDIATGVSTAGSTGTGRLTAVGSTDGNSTNGGSTGTDKSTGGGSAGRGGRPVPEKKATPRDGRRKRWAAPIAIAAGVVAFAGFGLSQLAGEPQQNTAADSAAAPGAGQDGAESGAQSAAEMAPQILTTGTDYTLESLAEEPPALLAAPEQSAAAAPKAPQRITAEQPELRRLSSSDVLRECLEAIQRENAGGLIAVQTVDYASFESASAVIVRFSAANGRWAWAAGPDCGTPGGGADTLGKVPVR